MNYRQAVSALIYNEQNQYLLIQSINFNQNEWKMVGGGIKYGESAEQALFREVMEEVGISKSQLKLIGKSSLIHKYTFNKEKQNNTGYKGQKRMQFVLKLSDQACTVKPNQDEIRKHKWVNLSDLESHLVYPGQYSNFISVLNEFSFDIK